VRRAGARAVLRMVALGAAVLAARADPARAAEIKVWTARALATVLAEVGPRFEKATGYRLAVTADLSPPFVKRARAGEPFDVLITGAGAARPAGPGGPRRPRYSRHRCRLRDRRGSTRGRAQARQPLRCRLQEGVPRREVDRLSQGRGEQDPRRAGRGEPGPRRGRPLKGDAARPRHRLGDGGQGPSCSTSGHRQRDDEAHEHGPEDAGASFSENPRPASGRILPGSGWRAGSGRRTKR
jgi:hypothetical protein